MCSQIQNNNESEHDYFVLLVDDHHDWEHDISTKLNVLVKYIGSRIGTGGSKLDSVCFLLIFESNPMFTSAAAAAQNFHDVCAESLENFVNEQLLNVEPDDFHHVVCHRGSGDSTSAQLGLHRPRDISCSVK